MCRMLAATLFPSTLLAAVAAPELIDWLLGPKWTHLAFMLRVFLPTSALSIVAVQVGAILLARDRFGVFFWCSLGLSVARVIVVALGFWGGLTIVVYGLAVVSLLQFAALLIGSEGPTGCRPASRCCAACLDRHLEHDRGGDLLPDAEDVSAECGSDRLLDDRFAMLEPDRKRLGSFCMAGLSLRSRSACS